MKIWQRVLLGLAAVVLLAVAGSLFWALTPLGPSEEARAALVSDSDVIVEQTADAWLFVPADTSVRRGFIFYPGGRVDMRSYAPLAHDLASEGIGVVLLKAPLSLAILDGDAAQTAFTEKSFATVQDWVVGGHSLGGVTAASFAADNPDLIDGLLLLASYPLEDVDLRGAELEATDVTAELDGVLNRENWEDGKKRLPADTEYVEIAGGNHAQFGDYGPQPGDNEARIPASEQRAEVVAAVRDLFDRIEATR